MKNGSNSLLTTLLPIVFFIVLMYFFLVRPQKKKDRALQEMRDNISVGDKIVTIGGIVGKIVKTKEDSFIIAVGSDKTKFEMQRWAVSKVLDSKGGKKQNPVEEDETPVKKQPKRLKKSSAKTEEEQDFKNDPNKDDVKKENPED